MPAHLQIDVRESQPHGAGPAATPPVLRRISRFALQQRSRIDAPDRADGTRRLMWAILKDTLSCYHTYADASTVHGQRLYREAERWLLASDLSWMFSFDNVCAVLEIDSESLRNELRRWRRARRQRAGEEGLWRRVE